MQRESGLIEVKQDFWMGKYPVTQRQWQAVMGSNSSEFIQSGEMAPVERVSWEDAQKFLQKVGQGFRLPTEAEWEFACRAGTTGDFNVDGAEVGELGWYGKNSNGQTQPVGQKLPNAWGLYDMHGNVWEWCQNWYDSDRRHRALRGGSWVYENGDPLRSSNRRNRKPSRRSNNIGFRCVCEVG